MKVEKHTYKNPLDGTVITTSPQEGWKYSSQGWDRIQTPKTKVKKKKGKK
tara:strand:+ start:9453 stop:9602 length:150 start_codon:yes stop_codon:yes gene_type:complete